MKRLKYLIALSAVCLMSAAVSAGASAEEPVVTSSVAAENEDMTVQTTVTTSVTNNDDATIQTTVTSAVTEVEDSAAQTTAASDETSVQYGWQEGTDGKKYYISENGEYVTGYQLIDGKEYYFAKKGVMKYG